MKEIKPRKKYYKAPMRRKPNTVLKPIAIPLYVFDEEEVLPLIKESNKYFGSKEHFNDIANGRD